MPINIDYSPVSAVGSGAYVSGLGQYNRWRDQFNLSRNQAAANLQHSVNSQAFGQVANTLSAEQQRTFQAQQAQDAFYRQQQLAQMQHTYQMQQLGSQAENQKYLYALWHGLPIGGVAPGVASGNPYGAGNPMQPNIQAPAGSMGMQTNIPDMPLGGEYTYPQQ